MKFNFKTILLSAFLFLSFLMRAQNSFDSEFILGGGMHTRGFLLSTQYSIIKDETKNITFGIDFTEIKSPKEKRITAERQAIGGTSNRSYIYGKQNNFYALRLGAGQRFYISEKTNKSIVALAFAYNGGFSLGMIKPYYLDLIYRFDPDGYRVVPEKYSIDNERKFLEPLDINGSSESSRGWDELTIAPGIFAKGSLFFDWGANDGFVKILELGMTADLYFRQIQIAIGELRPPVFVNLYMNFYFGKRW